MFEPGNLLFFKPFIFKNGAPPQDKFMVVLGKDANGNTLLSSLPTSKDHVPSDVPVKHGCIDMPERRVNVFVFMAGEDITIPHENGEEAFAFDENTFIYGADLDTYPVETFNLQIAEGDTDVKLIGKITDVNFASLKECLKISKMVKNKFKRIL